MKGVIFDLFKTLIHFKRQPDFFKQLLNEVSLDKNQLNNYMRNDYSSYSEYLKSVIPNSNIKTDNYEEFIKKEVASAELYPETIETLEILFDKNVKIGLISNLGAPYKQPFYNLGLDKYIQTRVFSCDFGFIKPEIQIYKIAVEKLELKPEEIIMTGDTMLADVIGPQKIGINAVLLDRINNSKNSISSLKEIIKYF